MTASKQHGHWNKNAVNIFKVQHFHLTALFNCVYNSLDGSAVLEGPWPPSNEGFFIWLNLIILTTTRGGVLADKPYASGAI